MKLIDCLVGSDELDDCFGVSCCLGPFGSSVPNRAQFGSDQMKLPSQKQQFWGVFERKSVIQQYPNSSDLIQLIQTTGTDRFRSESCLKVNYISKTRVKIWRLQDRK